MSALAVRPASVNLGQGFPDTDGPAEIARGRGRRAARRARTSTRPASASPRCAAGDRRAPAALLRHRSRPRHRGARHHRRHRGDRGALLALVDPGDEVVALEPYYDSYAAVHRDGRGRPRAGHAARAGLPARHRRAARRGHRPDPGAAAQHPAQPDRHRADAATSCGRSPSSPIEHDLVVVTDEVYEHLTLRRRRAHAARHAARHARADGDDHPAPARRSRSPAGRSAGRRGPRRAGRGRR